MRSVFGTHVPTPIFGYFKHDIVVVVNRLISLYVSDRLPDELV